MFFTLSYLLNGVAKLRCQGVKFPSRCQLALLFVQFQHYMTQTMCVVHSIILTRSSCLAEVPRREVPAPLSACPSLCTVSALCGAGRACCSLYHTYSIELLSWGAKACSSRPVVSLPFSLYSFSIIWRRPCVLFTHSIRPHSSFRGITDCKQEEENVICYNISTVTNISVKFYTIFSIANHLLHVHLLT